MRLSPTFLAISSLPIFTIASDLESPHTSAQAQKPDQNQYPFTQHEEILKLDGLSSPSPSESQSQSHSDLSEIISSSPLLSFHRTLCEIESITNNELAVGEFLVQFLQAHNFSIAKQIVPQPEGSEPQGRERFNVYAVPNSDSDSGAEREGDDDGNGPKVLLTSHIDTVPPFLPYKLSAPAPSSSSSSISTSKPDSDSTTSTFNRSTIRIAGRGTVDAKACVAAQIHAVLDLLNASHIAPSTIALLFVVGEELNGDGMSYFSSSPLYQYHLLSTLQTVIFGEPTELNLASGHKGVLVAKVAARGKAAHSGYPWLGRSANSMILPALTVLDQLGDVPERLPRSGKYGNSTVNIGVIRGGIAANVIPAYAEASIFMRLAGGTPHEARTIVEKAVRGVSGGKELDIEFSQGYGPVDIDADVEGFGVMTVNYGTDVPNLRVREGVKRYLYGPGSILVAHGEREALTVGELEQSVHGYQRLVLHALGKERAMK